MAATETQTAVEQLAELEEASRDVEQRREQIGRDRRAALRRLKAAEDKRLALEEERAAGGEVSDGEIAEAVEAVAVARENADERVWNARLAGAERAVEEAAIERDEFGRRHFAEIAAEEAALDGPARDALVEAWDALQAAAGAYAVRARRWHHLGRYGGLTEGDLPNGTPLSGDIGDVARRFETGLPVPTPRALREG